MDRFAFVFFDTDSALIASASAAILDNYVATFEIDPPLPHFPVVIWGNADRAGPAHYNLKLSKRRANAVAAYLRRKGLKHRIVIEAHGETRPLVETRDGTAESQNRFVGIYVDERTPEVRQGAHD